MTKNAIVRDLFKKSIFPLALATILFLVFKSLFTEDGVTDYLYVWILCGLPFGLGKLRMWFYYHGSSLGTAAAIFLMNFIIAGLIGGFVLTWKVAIAFWYILVTICRLIKYR